MATASSLSPVVAGDVDANDILYIVIDGVPHRMELSEAGLALVTVGGVAAASHGHTAANVSDFAAATYAAIQPVHSTETANFTLGLGHLGQITPLSKGTPGQVLLPANATTAIPVGSTALLRDIGGARWTVVPDTGVTLNPQANVVGNPTTLGVNSYLLLIKTLTNTWDYIGSVSTRIPHSVVLAVDGTLTTGDGARRFPVPASLHGYNLVNIKGFLKTASASGGPILIQLHNITQAVDMLTVRLSIDDTETSSLLPVTAVQIDTNNDDVAENDILRVDIDDHGSGAVDLSLALEFA